MKLSQHSKINKKHLDRKAVVYLRQSSDKQVRQNTESQRLQYALVNRAKELGWEDIETIDIDLGFSAGLGAVDRIGFDRMIALVAKGEVGIVLSREVSRLSRTDKDWCRLLEVCQIFGTLIGDAEQIYDLSLLDDQLILGIKGTMSVVELKVLQMRLLAGTEEKARRGELIKLLPPGYVIAGKDKVSKDPDERVQQGISLVFKKFRELWSIRQTFLWFHTNGVELPVNKSIDEKIKIVWQLPTKSFIKDVLTNAFYAGVYVYGRRITEKTVEEGKVVKKIGRILKPEECRVFIPDHHEGYIDWETYLENRRMINANSLNLEKDESVAGVRAGQGLLSGVLRCGICGRMMHVRYWGKSGTAARYLCKGDFDSGGKYCQVFGGGTVDRRFSKEILRVLSPFGIQASMEAIKRIDERNDDRRRALEKQLQQMEYEVRRAFEQYNEADPRNRLVAAELERRWNQKLEEVETLKMKLTKIDDGKSLITENERDKILNMGQNFQSVWESEHCRPETKKKIIRTVIEEVIVNPLESGEDLQFVIHWKGGCHTAFEMGRPKSGAKQKTSEEDLEIIRKMGVRYGDEEIARVLSRLGRRTGKGKRWNEQHVRDIRHKYSIPGQKNTKEDPEILSLGEAARYCNVSQGTIKKLVMSQILKKEQVVPWAPWEIKRSDLDSELVRKIIEHLQKTGKLILNMTNLGNQMSLFQ